MSEKPIHSLVRLHYGPYEAHGVARHRTERLRGIQEQLTKRGIPLTLIPSFHWDRVEIEIAGQNVFRCRQTFLQYNNDGSNDRLCQKAVETVMESLKRIIPSLYNYHEVFQILKQAEREEYLNDLLLYHRTIIENMFDDVVQSAYVFCQNTVETMLNNALNFLNNYCHAIVIETVDAACSSAEGTETLHVCQQIASNVVDEATSTAEFVHQVADNIDKATPTVDKTITATPTADKTITATFISQIVENIVDAATSSAQSQNLNFCQNILENIITTLNESLESNNSFSENKDNLFQNS